MGTLLQQAPTHRSAQLSEPDMREYPTPPRATHHRPPQNLTVRTSAPCHSKHTPFHATFTNLFHSALSCTVTLACSKVHPLSFKASLTPSNHTLFGLPLPLLPSTPDANTIFANLSSSIRSTCPNHLRTHLSTLSDKSFCTPTLLLISSFLILSLIVTPHILLKHLISLHLIFFFPNIQTPCLCSI